MILYYVLVIFYVCTVFSIYKLLNTFKLKDNQQTSEFVYPKLSVISRNQLCY